MQTQPGKNQEQGALERKSGWGGGGNTETKSKGASSPSALPSREPSNGQTGVKPEL